VHPSPRYQRSMRNPSMQTPRCLKNIYLVNPSALPMHPEEGVRGAAEELNISILKLGNNADNMPMSYGDQFLAFDSASPMTR